MDHPIPPSLSREARRHLRDLIARMEGHVGKWGTSLGGERRNDGSFTMPWVQEDPLASEAMSFLYDNGLIVPFNWGAWDEGRAIFRDTAEDRFERLDRLTVLKLLTAVARNDRFNDGAWVALFECGDAQRLLRRLLELELRTY
jgi:hypothetical protein